MARMRRIRTRIAEYHSAERLRALGVDVFFGGARFTAANTCGRRHPVALQEGADRHRRAAPTVEIPGLEEAGYSPARRYSTKSLPGRLAIIGGGPLGCEAAQAFSRLGSQVTIVQNDPNSCRARNGRPLSSCRLAGARRRDTRSIPPSSARGSRTASRPRYGQQRAQNGVAADEVLLSIGACPMSRIWDWTRPVSLSTPGPASRSTISCARPTPGYAAGDVCLSLKFTNAAQASARMAVQNAFGAKRRQKAS